MRKNGYYWVDLHDSYHDGDYRAIAEWQNGEWYFFGVNLEDGELELSVSGINETAIKEIDNA